MYHMSVCHLVINHTLVWKRLYTSNSLIMSGHLSWQMTEGRNPGKDKVITAFHCLRLALLVSTCILFQLGSPHWRKMPCTNCCLLLSPSDLWICSNPRAFFSYICWSPGAWMRPREALHWVTCMHVPCVPKVCHRLPCLLYKGSFSITNFGALVTG